MAYGYNGYQGGGYQPPPGPPPQQQYYGAPQQQQQQPFGSLSGPLGINRQFMVPFQETLVLFERGSFLTDDSTVHNAQGRPIIFVGGSAFRGPTTTNGAPLFQLRKESHKFHHTYDLIDPSGSSLAQIKSNFSSFTARFDMTFRNAAGNNEEVVFQVRGGVSKRTAEITWNGQPVARYRPRGGDTFSVEVLPHVDVALVMGFVVAMEVDHDVDASKAVSGGDYGSGSAAAAAANNAGGGGA